MTRLQFRQHEQMLAMGTAPGIPRLQALAKSSNLKCPYEMAGHQEVPGPQAVCSFSDRFHRRSDDQRPASGLALHFPASSRCGCRRGFRVGRSNRNNHRFTPARRAIGIYGASSRGELAIGSRQVPCEKGETCHRTSTRFAFSRKARSFLPAAADLSGAPSSWPISFTHENPH